MTRVQVRVLGSVLICVVYISVCAISLKGATVAYYRFDNGTADAAASGTNSILDSSGHGFNGTPFDAPVYDSNIPVNPVPLTGSSNSLSMNFNGTAWQRVNVPDNPSFQLTHSLTLEAYVNLGRLRHDRQFDTIG